MSTHAVRVFQQAHCLDIFNLRNAEISCFYEKTRQLWLVQGLTHVLPQRFGFYMLARCSHHNLSTHTSHSSIACDHNTTYHPRCQKSFDQPAKFPPCRRSRFSMFADVPMSSCPDTKQHSANTRREYAEGATNHKLRLPCVIGW